MSLGPVVRNVHANEHAEPPKPHLAERQEDEEIRYNALGAIVSVDGKLTFRPAYAGKNPAVLPVPYKEPAYVPFQGDNAYLDPAPMQKSAPKVSADTKSCGFAVGDRVEKIEGYALNGKHGQVVSVGNFAGENTLLRVKFDQVQEPQEFYARRFKKVGAVAGSPWQVGDRVRMRKDRSINPGKIGRVVSVEPRGESHVILTLDWEENPDKDDGKWTLNKVAHSSYFEILPRGAVDSSAPAPLTEEKAPTSALQNGDRVKVSAASPWLQGKSGVIRTVDTDNTCLVQPDGGGQAMWICNDYLAKLVAAAPAK